MAVLLALLPLPAAAQQWIQIPSCGGTLPATINPSTATITVNPSGQLCVLTGSITVTVPTPSVQIATPLSINIPQVGAVVSGAYADGAIVGIGSTADGPAPSPTAIVGMISLLKGIMTNTMSPISVAGNFSTTVTSPLGVNIAATTPINVTVGGIVSPQNVTVASSPVAVTIASSPVNVTGNFTSTQTGQNIAQLAGQTLASPSTYGVAPVGSVQGMNAFVTNNVNVTTPTPLQVTLPASPISVGIAGPTPLNVTLATSPVSVSISTVSSPVNVTGNFSASVTSPLGVVPFSGASPQNVTFSASPVSVAISTVSSPVNVTGNFQATIASPAAMNLVQVQNVNIASPSTYGAAPVGSVQGMNAFVTNNVNVTPPTPLNVTLATSPVSVAISTVSSPVNVTGSLSVTPASPQNTNLVQIDGQQIASPTTYGVAPVGSVQAVNAFITNTPLSVTPPTPLQITLPASPISVGVSASPLGVAVVNNVTVTTPTPLQVTFPASPISVGIAGPTPLNVTVGNASPTNFNLVQVQGTTIASPSTYGVAPVGSVGAFNAFVTNNVNVTPPTPLQVTFPASPVSVGLPATPLNVTLATSPVSVSISTVSSPINVTGSLSVTPASPQNTNLVQVQGVAVASPSTYGVAPVGSVQGINAFVTNNVNVTPPTPLQITLPASPITVAISTSPQGVAVVNNVSVTPPTPLQITLPASPISVGISATPLNVTVATSPINTNLVQLEGTALASPSTYGVAPVGSVQGVNAFVTNNVNVTTPTPLQITLPASPISVGISATPLNMTLVAIPGTPISVVQSQSPQNVTVFGSPQNMTIALPMPDACTYQAKTNTPVAAVLTGLTQIVTGSVGQNVQICAISLVAQAGATVSIVEGVGQNCSGVPTANSFPIWGASPVASGLAIPANGGIAYGSGIGTVGQTKNVSDSVCIFSTGVSTNQFISGNIVYVYK